MKFASQLLESILELGLHERGFSLHQELKGCSWHEEKAKLLLMLYYRLLDCPKVKFEPKSTFAPLKW